KGQERDPPAQDRLTCARDRRGRKVTVLLVEFEHGVPESLELLGTLVTPRLADRFHDSETNAEEHHGRGRKQKANHDDSPIPFLSSRRRFRGHDEEFLAR